MNCLAEEERKKLQMELQQIKKERMKRFHARKDDIERQSMVLKGFENYVEELLDKGTACHISQSAHELMARAEELVKLQEEIGESSLDAYRATFVPADSEDIVNGRSKLLGWISINGDLAI